MSDVLKKVLELLEGDAVIDSIDLTLESEGESDSEEEPTTSDEEFIDDSDYEDEDEEEEEPTTTIYVPKGHKVVVYSE